MASKPRPRRRQRSRVKSKQETPVPTGLVTATIERLGHDGRGITRIDGKTTFIEGALTGETVEFEYLKCHNRYDEAIVRHYAEPAIDRVEAPCEHASTCGGCSLQHMNVEAQVQLKQSVLLEQVAHIGKLQPERVVAPIIGESKGYRRKARLAVRHSANGVVVVGFREKSSSRVVPINRCIILAGSQDKLVAELQTLISGLQCGFVITHIDITMDDKVIAIVFRHVKPLPDCDFQALLAFCQSRQFHCYLQPGQVDSMYRVWPDVGPERLSYALPSFQLELVFHPSDFIQVNALNNRKLVEHAIELLDLTAEDRVLDLFCGIGNFTLPIATVAGQVVGVEGDALMVCRGKENAHKNQLSNIDFYGADLNKAFDDQLWAAKGFSKILIDPPRAGALEVVKNMAKLSPEKIVYVSCNPSTLARDAGELGRLGYQLVSLGVVDMFPHTEHVESIALFEQRKKAKSGDRRNIKTGHRN